jgi:hypothetical protein
MSYQTRPSGDHVVVCDLCGDFSGIYNRDWRRMSEPAGDQPIHLCHNCQHLAVWCPAHQQYHRPDVFHRRGCADCGGLFTSIVREQLTRCPSCCRAAGERSALPAPQRAEQPSSLARLLFALRTGQRR